MRTIDVPVKETNYGHVTIEVEDDMSPEEIQEKVYNAMNNGETYWKDTEYDIQRYERKTFKFEKVISGTATIDYNETMTQDEIIEAIDDVLTDTANLPDNVYITARGITYDEA